MEAIRGKSVTCKSFSSFANDDTCFEQVNIVFESVLGLNGDKIADFSLAVAEDMSTTTNRLFCLGFRSYHM